MSGVQTVTASDLIGEASQPQAPTPSASELLPAGYRVKEHFPGAGYGRHPVLKRFVSFKQLREDQIERGTPANPQPTPAPAPEPMPQPAPAPEPEPAPDNPPAPEPQPQAEPQPDFSDLGGGEQQQQQAAPGANAEQHRPLVTMLWSMILALLIQIFGPEWKPGKIQTPAGEVSEDSFLITAACDALEYIGAKVLNPIEKFWVAAGCYCVPRISTIIRWWTNRATAGMKQARAKDTTPRPEPTAPESEAAS